MQKDRPTNFRRAQRHHTVLSNRSSAGFIEPALLGGTTTKHYTRAVQRALDLAGSRHHSLCGRGLSRFPEDIEPGTPTAA